MANMFDIKGFQTSYDYYFPYKKFDKVLHLVKKAVKRKKYIAQRESYSFVLFFVFFLL